MADPQALLRTLEERFARNAHRHDGLAWADVRARLDDRALEVLGRMEATGGEPDVVGTEGEAVVFADCSPESPAGRRSACYDRAAREGRKKFPPERSAAEWAAEIGIELLDEAGYAALQALEPFDRKTSSWLRTPGDVREKGGALFGDRRFGRVFVYHNGADSYYAARGFRGRLIV